MNIPPQKQFLRPDRFWSELGLQANQTVTHLGCGAGFFLLPAAKIVGPKGKVIGVDIRSDILQEAISRVNRAGFADIVTTIRADLEKGPIKIIAANTSDWTLALNILSQADPKKILSEAKRVTKPTGTIVLVEWSTSQAIIGPPVEQRLPKNQLLATTQAVALRLEQEFEPSPYHYGLLLKT